MSGFENASKEELDQISTAVTQVLDAAGIPWSYSPVPTSFGRAEIIVESSGSDRGVFISWTSPRKDIDAAKSAITARQLSDSSIGWLGDSKEVAIRRVAEVLSESGIVAEETDEDFSPYILEVLSVEIS
ncbi:hypothetical protein [Salininema proteolyticum]|uniref:DUF3168 domain-containing protein n=1 Tax=Salininema proteolyticum TaxID=1607685 RepID=A0ABV8U2Z3_9ACTN